MVAAVIEDGAALVVVDLRAVNTFQVEQLVLLVYVSVVQVDQV